MPKVDCDAYQCEYNDEGCCDAYKIELDGNGVCMADLIERDAAIDCLDSNAFESYENAVMTLHKIEDIPAVNRWIPVEDALPEIGYSVLVTRHTESNTRYIRIASRQDDCWMDNTDKYGKPNPHPVIAWMPMPDAYKPPEKE